MGRSPVLNLGCAAQVSRRLPVIHHHLEHSAQLEDSQHGLRWVQHPQSLVLVVQPLTGCEQHDEAARIEERHGGEVEVEVADARSDHRLETLAQLGCSGEVDLAGDSDLGVAID
jgi:hypothetical protein